MRRLHQDEVDRLLKYLECDVDNCVYMYIDLKTYSIEKQEITVWVEEQEDIIFVVMKYYDSFQIYSRNKAMDCTNLVNLVKEYHVKMISGPDWMIQLLAEKCSEYEATYGSVYAYKAPESMIRYEYVEKAKPTDAREIAEMLCTDKEFGSNYTVEVLTKQLRDRMDKGLGRSYIVREQGRIVAHVATYAECDTIAVISGNFVSKEYSHTNYHEAINATMNGELHDEGKRIYAFATGKKMIRWLNYCIGESTKYGKLVPKE